MRLSRTTKRAWLFFLFAPSLAFSQQTVSESDQLAVLEGTVVNALTKKPVAKASVSLELSIGAHDSVLVAKTSEGGQFRFADIKAGTYKLTVEKTGFLDGVFGGSKPEDRGTLLKVAGGDQLKGLNLLLFPGGTISGQVLDADGDPIADSRVVLWTRDRRHGKTSDWRINETTTNKSGEYHFDGLSSGTYDLGAIAGDWGYAKRQVPVDSSGKVTKLHDLTTYYADVLSLQDAHGVIVESGQEQTGINIRIQRGLALSVNGRIAGMLGSPSEYKLNARIQEGDGAAEPGKILPNRDFAFLDLPPGRHVLTLLGNGPKGLQEMGKTEVNLADQDATGVVIDVNPVRPARVRVRVVMESDPNRPVAQGTVFLHPAETTWTAGNTFEQFEPHDGVYVFDTVPPGKYQPWFNGVSDCYLKAVQLGERKLDSQLIDVTEGVTLDLQMMLSRNGATVTGEVEVSQDHAKPSVHVLLISEDQGQSNFRSHWAATDQSLHFVMSNLPPGKYRAFAVEDDEGEGWENEDFIKALQSEGADVELHEKDQTKVHLKLIPKEQTDLVRRRLGL